MKITFEEYENLLKQFKALPNLKTENYGVTQNDLDYIASCGEKYIPYLMYLTTRPYYCFDDSKRQNKFFINSDALPCWDVADQVDDLLDSLIDLVD